MAAVAPIVRVAAAQALKRRRKRKQGGGKSIAVFAGLLACVFAVPLVAVGVIAGIAGQPPAPAVSTTDAAAATGIPAPVLAAYQANGNRCSGLDWTLLAAVGGVESNHGQLGGSSIDPQTNEARPLIFGPALDGTGGTARIPIGQWVGWWGLTGPWTRAGGPMQFLPGTFQTHATDGNADGTTSPHQIDDATATAAAYLCNNSGDGAIDGPDEIARIYNPGSSSYAQQIADEQQAILDALTAANQPSAATGSATVCPVAGRVEFTDTWGASRAGGRSHQGVDIFAPAGTPLPAPASGTVEHGSDSLGGLAYRLTADDGTYYYGAHLSAFANQGAGHVQAGTIIGYVGNTGDAATTPSHLHWQIHPQGRGSEPVNPTPAADAVCDDRA